MWTGAAETCFGGWAQVREKEEEERRKGERKREREVYTLSGVDARMWNLLSGGEVPDYGLIVQLAPGVDTLLHKSQLSHNIGGGSKKMFDGGKNTGQPRITKHDIRFVCKQ